MSSLWSHFWDYHEVALVGRRLSLKGIDWSALIENSIGLPTSSLNMTLFRVKMQMGNKTLPLSFICLMQSKIFCGWKSNYRITHRNCFFSKWHQKFTSEQNLPWALYKGSVLKEKHLWEGWSRKATENSIWILFFGLALPFSLKSCPPSPEAQIFLSSFIFPFFCHYWLFHLFSLLKVYIRVMGWK